MPPQTGTSRFVTLFDVMRGGCVIVGEALFVDERRVGETVGFDETHEPNHLNIVASVRHETPGSQLKIWSGAR